MDCQTISLSRITVPPSHRATKPAAVAALAASILEIGLQNPIGIVKDGRDYRLLHGRHRLDAQRSLGRLDIDAIIFDLNDLRCQLAEIDENLIRRSLNKMEEAKALKRRKAIYLELHPETKQGATLKQGPKRQVVATGVSSFASDTAAKTGRSRRSVERDVALGEAVCDEAAEILADSPVADNRTALAAIGNMEPEQQVEAAKTAAANKTTPRSARTPRKEVDEPSFCRDLDALIDKHLGKHKTPKCIIESVLQHKLDWLKEQT